MSSTTVRRSITTLETGAVDDMTALARLAAVRYGLSADCQLELFPLTENWTYRITDPSRDPMVLRLYRPGGRPAVEILSELAWMKAIREDEQSLVPDVICAPEGGEVIELVRDPLPTCFGVMFSCAPGHEPAEAELAAWFPRLGSITARLHQQARRWQPPTWFDRPRWDLATTLGDRPHWGPWQRGVDDPEERRQLTRLADVVRMRLGRFGIGPARFGLVHADLRLANLLVDGERLTVIDFDDCGHSWFMYDLACALTFNEGHPDVDGLIDAWVDGYREVEHLDKNDEAEIPTFLMLRRLLVSAYVGLRPDTDLATELGDAKFAAESCAIAEKYLGRYG
jgi:Ser/Thr protein kinase RdoA (MazF antagonist)